MAKRAPATFALPAPYRLFFLTIEPLTTIAGAYYGFLKHATYLNLTDPAAAAAPMPLSVFPDPITATADIPRATTIALTQLGNMYLLFALIESLVLRSTADLRVWRAVLFSFLVADLGHLYSVHSLGWDKYYRVDGWNAMDFGNIAVVYMGALLRIAFLAGVGFGKQPGKVKQ